MSTFKFNLLFMNPQKKGVVIKVYIVTPKKPNSARRSVTKILLVNNFSLLSYITGIGHNLRKHSMVLVIGGGARDLPGVSYSCVRNSFDLLGVINRKTRRSIYGAAKPDELKTKIRRKFRQI